MREYQFSDPERQNWGVPATIQALLRARKIIVGQQEIFPYFPPVKGPRDVGLQFNNQLLSASLRKFGLTSEFRNPFVDPTLHRAEDLFLSRVEGDVIVAYDVATERESFKGHLALFVEYSIGSDLVDLSDIHGSKSLRLSDLTKRMHPYVNENCGFYIVS